MKREKKKREGQSISPSLYSISLYFVSLSLVRRASADIVMMNESVSGRTCAGECASAETRQKRKDSSLLLQQTTASFLPVVCCILMAHSSAGSIARAFSFRSSFLFTLFGIHFHCPFFLLSFSYIYTTMSTWACRRTSTHQFADSARNGCRRHFIVSRV